METLTPPAATVVVTSTPALPHSPLNISPVGSENPEEKNPGMAPSEAQHPRSVSKDAGRRAVSTQGSSPAPLRTISLPLGDDRPLTPPVSALNPVHAARSESLPLPYPSGSNSSLSASTSTLRATSSSSPRTPRAQSTSRRSTPGDSPTSTTTTRRLPTPNASSTSLSATPRDAVAKSPRTPAPDQPPPARFRAVPRLPNMQDVEPAPPPVMYWSKAPVWGALPTHGFRAHTVTLADNVAWIFGGCDDRGCFKDMWCFNIGEPNDTTTVRVILCYFPS